MKSAFLLMGLAGFGLTLKPILTGVHLFFQIRKLEQVQQKTPDNVSGIVPEQWQKKIEKLANEAGVKKLTNLSVNGPVSNQEISLIWESSLPVVHQFLILLQNENATGPTLRLQMSASPVGVRLVTAKASFQMPEKRKTITNDNSIDRPPLRNVFASSSRMETARVSSVKTTLGPNTKELEKMEKELNEREEVARLENKKRELESALALTGIVNNGREPLAVIDARGASRRTWMVKVADMLNGARVVAIDERQGEVTLDYESKIKVVLRLSSGGPAQP